jgi:23S rRNA pseudouridine2605 synthase
VTGVRLNRYLAARGIASRRGADELALEGRVTVNGVPAAPGTLVDDARDEVRVDGRSVPRPLARRTLLVNKPLGVVSTRSDPQGRPTILDLVDDPAGLFPVGRLDIDSRGLLLLTTDGELALRLTHPRHGVTKRYHVTVRGHAPERSLRAMERGVELQDGPARVLSARTVGAHAGQDVVELVMAEGRKREVRRMCAAVGLTVVDLQRVAIGPVQLGRLHEGTSRPLRPTEERELYAAAGIPQPAGRVRTPPARG